MQLSYHSTQWDPTEFDIIQYSDSKNIKIMWIILKYGMVAFIVSYVIILVCYRVLL